MTWNIILLVLYCSTAALCSPEDLPNYYYVDVKTDWSVLDFGLIEDCGTHSSSYRDNLKNIGKFPWLTKLLYTDPKAPECSGVLITKSFVLTSRNCILSQKLSAVLIGEYDAKKDWTHEKIGPSDHVARLSIHDKIMHPTSNIGLIRLSDQIKFNNSWVHPICLPWNRGNVPRQSTGEVTGWTHLGKNKKISNDALLHIHPMTVLSRPACLKELSFKEIHDDEFCANTVTSGDNCKGVPGGPFMVQRKIKGVDTYFTVGIQTFERHACDLTQPIMYTNVGYHMDWILDNIHPIFEVWIALENQTAKTHINH